MLKIKVKRDYTNLGEVLFEADEISGLVELEKYMDKHQVTIEVDNGTERNVEPRMRLMKGDILMIKEIVSK